MIIAQASFGSRAVLPRLRGDGYDHFLIRHIRPLVGLIFKEFEYYLSSLNWSGASARTPEAIRRQVYIHDPGQVACLEVHRQRRRLAVGGEPGTDDVI